MSAPTHEAGEGQALLFTVGSERYALPLTAVREVALGAWPRREPRSPLGCLGVLEVRGCLVPLLDLAVLLALAPPRSRDTLAEVLVDRHMLLLEPHVAQAALLVDRVLGVEPMRPLAEGEGVAHGPRARFWCGVVNEGARRALVLAPEALLSARRRRLLARLTAPEGGAS